MKVPVDESTNLGFQIAPMIDVVFVIMLFFMVMAGAVKTEKQLLSTLPGTAATSESTDMPDEQTITIAADGEVALNDEAFDSPTSEDMPELTGTLTRLKEASDAAKSELLVTIVSDEDAKYKRTVNVLDACAAAQIVNVTFTVAEPE